MASEKKPTARDIARIIEKIGKDMAATFDNRTKTRHAQQNAAVVCIDTNLAEEAEITRQPDGGILARIPVEVVFPNGYTPEEVGSLRFVAFGTLTHDKAARG